jgi:hypothetical protein
MTYTDAKHHQLPNCDNTNASKFIKIIGEKEHFWRRHFRPFPLYATKNANKDT